MQRPSPLQQLLQPATSVNQAKNTFRSKQVSPIFSKLHAAAAKHQAELGPNDVERDGNDDDVQLDAVQELDDRQHLASSQCRRRPGSRRLEGEVLEVK